MVYSGVHVEKGACVISKGGMIFRCNASTASKTFKGQMALKSPSPPK